MSDETVLKEEKDVKTKKSVFKNKNFVLLFMGLFVSNIGNMLYNFAISLYILDITNNNAIIAGLYMATGGVVFALIAPFGGAIVDRLERVKVIYITDFIRGITILFAGYLLFMHVSDSVQVPMLFLVTIILSINNALFEPAATALPANILESDLLQQSNSVIQGSNALYGIIGVFFGAALYEFFGIQVVFIVNGLSFVFSAISEMFITVKTKQDITHQITLKTVTTDISEGFKYLIKFKPMMYLILMAMMFNFFLTPATSNGLPYLFKVEINASSFYYSLIMAIFPIGLIIASIILGAKKQEAKIFKSLKFGFIGLSIAFILFSVLTNFYVSNQINFLYFMIGIIAMTLLMGIGMGYVNVPAMTSLQVNIDKKLQGRVFSVVNVIAMGLTPISIALGGIIINKFGLISLFYICSIAMIVLTLVGVTNKFIKQL